MPDESASSERARILLKREIGMENGTSAPNAILGVRNVSKRFGGVTALNDVSFDLEKGEVLGLVGDNGAGKSTLIKIISGFERRDSGEILFEGKRVEINSPKDAKELGIETVYQDLALVERLNVPGNIFLGRELKHRGVLGDVFYFLNFRKMHQESKKLLGNLQVNVPNLDSMVKNLSGGQRQSVAISKVIYWGKKVVILDEPTAALGVQEAKKVLQLIRELKTKNISVIVISHNLQHVLSIVDRVMVLRRGRRVGILKSCEATPEDIVTMITGAKETIEI